MQVNTEVVAANPFYAQDINKQERLARAVKLGLIRVSYVNTDINKIRYQLTHAGAEQWENELRR